ncbi:MULTISPECIES: sulfatase [unclassified Lentimonas]|uniref:sulfatase n=1 Tax=unclassified Lentimonas TaxID=2630993 RepID=UPI001325618D|nr:MULTISPECIES: sulfatase [unclassified Lentimonas]CAA6689507.1 Choline-sulfatase (EC [Lentimonas sp. CC19]CAA6692519.1 Choline-sulfatase (EC [Lentimonas sp. CC10]CAA7069158.1 Choline-sulfatase (EC [Lentimonas sp. CC11]
MNKIKKTLVAGFLAAACLPMLHAKVEQPNIIIFYVDDLGWQATQINDVDKPSPYETPNIVKLAESGMNFTQAYSPAPTCSPSRAAINSGQHPAKTRFTHVTLDNRKDVGKGERLLSPYLEGQFDRNHLTSADALKANGYRTGHTGKWHIGLSSASYGFDFVNEDRGIHRSVPDRTQGFATAEDPKYPLSQEKYPPFSAKKPEGISYPYDEVTESAIQFMAESGDQPFFLDLCHWMVHWPAMTRNGELLEYYCDKLGQQFPPKKGAMSLPGQNNPYFAAMVTSVDWSLGRIVDFLKKTDDPRNPGKKLIETTYIFFSSDNGGALRHGQEMLSDNSPLKNGKTYAEEGGVRVPMVITGPGIAAGAQFDGMINQLDFFPTFLELTDSKIAAKDFAKLSGLDITPILMGESTQVLDAEGNEREFLFWHYPHNPIMTSAIRSGDFKLYKRYDSGEYELYRLYNDGQRNDFEEANDLAKNPEYASVVEQLSGLLEASLVANNAELPYLNPNYSKKTESAATVGKSSFKAGTRNARVSVQSGGPVVKEAWVIYCDGSKAEKHKRGSDKPVTAEFISGMRLPATVSKDGLKVSATIPESIEAYCFMLIDANGFMQYTDVVAAK